MQSDNSVKQHLASALETAISRFDTHTRFQDKQWVDSLIGRYKSASGGGAMRDGDSTAAFQAKQMAEEEAEGILESEAMKSNEAFQQAVARSGDPELQRLAKAHKELGEALASANETYNIEVQSQYAQDRDDFAVDEYTWLGTPALPETVETNPSEAKSMIRKELVSFAEQLKDVDDSLREGYDPDYADEYDDGFASSMPEGLGRLTEGARFKGDYARAVDQWLESMPGGEGPSHIPSFGDAPVKDAKTVSPPKPASNLARGEVSAALPDGVSMKESGYGDRY